MKIFYITIIFVLGISCSNRTNNDNLDVMNETMDQVIDNTSININNFDLDTILEKNNPNAVDLDKHAFFIDTTGNSIFYNDLVKWNQKEYRYEMIQNYYSKDPIESCDNTNIEFTNFPTMFLVLKSIDNQLVLYEPSDGDHTRIEIAESRINYHFVWESEVDIITNIKLHTDNELELGICTSKQKSINGEGTINLKKIKEDLYLMTSSYSEFESNYLLVPINKISNYDLVVCSSPKQKVLDKIKFDRIDYNKYK